MSRKPFTFCPHCRTELLEGMHGGRPRRSCPRAECGFVHWDNPIPVVAAIVEREGRVVLVRSHGWPETWYGLVTGFLEPDETPEHAVLREVDEEIGISAELGDYIGAYPFQRMNQIIFTYHVRGGEGAIRLGEHELADYKEVPIERLRPWSQGTGPALRDWLATRGYHPPMIEFGEVPPD